MGYEIFNKIEDLIKTEKTFKYSLLMDMNNVVDQSSDGLIDELFNITKTQCELFANIPDFCNGASLHSWIGGLSASMMFAALKNHCIISALYTCQKLFLNNTNITLYKLGALTNDSGFWKMYNSLSENEKANISKEPSTILKSFKYEKCNEDQSNLAHIWDRMCDGDRLTFYKCLFSDQQGKNSVFSLFNAPLKYAIIKSNSKFKYKSSEIDKYKKNDRFTNFKIVYDNYTRLWDNVQEILNNPECPCTGVDRLIADYELERFTKLDMLTSIILALDAAADVTDKRILKDNFYDIIPKLVRLPATFSIEYFINAAFYSADICYQPFLKYQNNNPGYKTPNRPSDHWIYTLSLYCDTLSSITFPMFEKFFFITLYRKFENNINELAFNKDALFNMMITLSKYAEKNENILRMNFRGFSNANITSDKIIKNFFEQINRDSDIPVEEISIDYKKFSYEIMNEVIWNLIPEINSDYNLFEFAYNTKIVSSSSLANNILISLRRDVKHYDKEVKKILSLNEGIYNYVKSKPYLNKTIMLLMTAVIDSYSEPSKLNSAMDTEYFGVCHDRKIILNLHKVFQNALYDKIALEDSENQNSNRREYKPNHTMNV